MDSHRTRPKKLKGIRPIETASSVEILRKRVERLLERDVRSGAASELRARVLPFLNSLGSVALIGGAVRDIARGGRRAFDSDLDFIVYDGCRDSFRKRLVALDAVPNRFGGFRLRGFGSQVDVWHIADTWAKTAGLVDVNSLRDLLNCTFFDWDSAIYDLAGRKLVLPSNYFELIKSNVLDIRLEENPNEAGSVVRALRRAALWNVHFGPRLTRYVSRHLEKNSWSELTSLDEKAFFHPVLRFLDSEAIIKHLRKSTESGSCNNTMPIPNWRRQLALPLETLAASG